MCDYSLHNVATRPARVEDKLAVARHLRIHYDVALACRSRHAARFGPYQEIVKLTLGSSRMLFVDRCFQVDALTQVHDAVS